MSADVEISEAVGTPSSRRIASGEIDEFAKRYNVERSELAMGDYTDDELANAVYLHGNSTPSVESMLSGEGMPPIVYLTAAKDRIRWLSRKLEEQIATSKAIEAENAKLRSNLSVTITDSLNIGEIKSGDDGLSIPIEGGFAAVMANSFAKQLFESQATNYIEATFASDLYPNMGEIVVTVKRTTSKSPHILRQEAEDKAAALEEAVGLAQSQLGLSVKALEASDLFIRNGIELGYITMPQSDTPDSAHETSSLVANALASVRKFLAGWNFKS